MTHDLQGKTAVVTGGSKGIGFAIADALAAAGCNVMISARNEKEVQQAARTLSDRNPGTVAGVVCDVREHDDVRRMIAATVERFGSLHVLVNNAGVGKFAPMGELAPDDWRQVMQTNLDGVYYCCHEAIPHLRVHDDSWIINIASLAGKNPFAGGAAYNASKFALVGFSEALMLDVRQHGIRVNYIMPGSVATHFNDHTPNEQDAWKIQPEDIADLVMQLVTFPSRSLPSRIEIRPTKPPRK